MPSSLNISEKPKAILVAVQVHGVSDTEHAASLAELERLVTTLGIETIGRLSQKRRAPSTGSIIGQGKLKELAQWTGGSGIIHGFRKEGFVDDEETEEEIYLEAEEPSHRVKATLVVFDSEISPTQLRNLEEATGVEVLDRSGVILEIFSRHARSREARLQVEIAKLAYMAPRMRASHVGGDRQGGGIGSKGSGESAHELDSRRIRDRIAELKQQLESIRNEQITRRSNRSESRCVALVGYTNAGKSSLMRALTGSEVLVADKLFATLDTTVRALQPESTPRILISDTVGFIKKLPHDLVASFRSTLDEALAASLLLFTVDVSDPTFRSQLALTQSVLAEIGADQTASRLVLNKTDKLSTEELLALRSEYPEAIFISTRLPEDISRIRTHILDFFEEDMIDETILVPYTKGQVLGSMRERARVLEEKYEEEGTYVRVKASPEVLAWIRKQLS